MVGNIIATIIETHNWQEQSGRRQTAHHHRLVRPPRKEPGEPGEDQQHARDEEGDAALEQAKAPIASSERASVVADAPAATL